MTSMYQIGLLGSVSSLLTATIYQGILDENHKFWNNNIRIAKISQGYLFSISRYPIRNCVVTEFRFQISMVDSKNPIL